MAGGMHNSGVCVAGGMCGRGHSSKALVAGGMCGRGGVCSRGCEWQGGHGRGHAWQGGMYGMHPRQILRDTVNERAYPTGMHWKRISIDSLLFHIL